MQTSRPDSLTNIIIEVVRYDPWITATQVYHKVAHLRTSMGVVSGTLHRLARASRLVRVKNSWGTWVYNLP